MKDAVWNVRILITLCLACIGVMVFGRLAESWSQNHLADHDFLLYGAVGSIVAIFLIRSFYHQKKNDELIKMGSMWIRNRHMNRIVAYLFFGVLVFGVNSELKWVELLHLVFTVSAILSANLNMVFYYPKGKIRNRAIVAGALGIVLFIIGYKTGWYTTADGEGFSALPIAVWIIITTKIKIK